MKTVLIIFITLVAFIIGFFLKSLVDGIKNKENKKKTIKNILIRSFSGLFTSASIGFFSYKLIFSNHEYPNWLKALIILIGSVIIIYLIYISVYDVIKLEIPNISTLVFLILLLILNLVLLSLMGSDKNILLWDNTYFHPLENLIAGGVASFIIVLLVLLTNGMGAGDIRVAAYMGMLIGVSKIVIGFYVTILSAAFISIIYSVIIKKFHGVKVPFVPFIALGIFISFFFSSEIFDALNKFILKLFY